MEEHKIYSILESDNTASSFISTYGLNPLEGIDIKINILDLQREIKSSMKVHTKNESNKKKQSKLVGVDETGENINGELHWMWALQPSNLRYIHSDKSSGKLAIDKQFKNGLLKTKLVSDCHASYFNMNVAGHQICLAHILRDLIFLSELNTKSMYFNSFSTLTLHTKIKLLKEQSEIKS